MVMTTPEDLMRNSVALDNQQSLQREAEALQSNMNADMETLGNAAQFGRNVLFNQYIEGLKGHFRMSDDAIITSFEEALRIGTMLEDKVKQQFTALATQYQPQMDKLNAQMRLSIGPRPNIVMN